MIKSKQIWVPERAFGVCIWIMEDGMPLSDGDGVLCAEGLVGDENIERQVAQAAKYWTGSDAGECRWVSGARKITASEQEDQKARLSEGLIADPFEDFFDDYFGKRI